MTIAEEAGLPESYKPVDAPPIRPGTPPSPNPMAPYFGGSISPTLQHDADFVRTRYGSPNIPSLPLVPLSASGAPSVGAAIQSHTTINSSSTTNTTIVTVPPSEIAKFVEYFK